MSTKLSDDVRSSPRLGAKRHAPESGTGKSPLGKRPVTAERKRSHAVAAKKLYRRGGDKKKPATELSAEASATERRVHRQAKTTHALMDMTSTRIMESIKLVLAHVNSKRAEGQPAFSISKPAKHIITDVVLLFMRRLVRETYDLMDSKISDNTQALAQHVAIAITGMYASKDTQASVNTGAYLYAQKVAMRRTAK